LWNLEVALANQAAEKIFFSYLERTVRRDDSVVSYLLRAGRRVQISTEFDDPTIILWSRNPNLF
jgi:hypothetical protein